MYTYRDGCWDCCCLFYIIIFEKVKKGIFFFVLCGVGHWLHYFLPLLDLPQDYTVVLYCVPTPNSPSLNGISLVESEGSLGNNKYQK